MLRAALQQHEESSKALQEQVQQQQADLQAMNFGLESGTAQQQQQQQQLLDMQVSSCCHFGTYQPSWPLVAQLVIWHYEFLAHTSQAVPWSLSL